MSIALAAGLIGAEEPATLRQTDVFVSGADGYHTYRIPALMVSKKGTLLAFCEGRKDGRADSGDIDLLLKRSADHGATWSRPLTIWNDGTNTCGNPCAVLDEETGVIWLLMTHNDGRDKESAIKAKKGFGTRTVWVSRSNDYGETWEKPEEITKSVKDPSWGWYATGPGVGIQIKHGPRRGRLVIP
ncbi:MAG TPA: sialidase family protein, partial [Verrucomicrobiae bacterium]|nr:sialidase family protein [Verrucomicrobiae bacterium]